MNVKEFWELCKLVLTDWRVIFIAIFFIIFSSLAGYVVKYKKKPPKPKKKSKLLDNQPAKKTEKDKEKEKEDEES